MTLTDDQIKGILRKVHSWLKDNYEDEHVILDEKNLIIIVKKFLKVPIEIIIRVKGKQDLRLDALYIPLPIGDAKATLEFLLCLFQRDGFHLETHDGKLYIYGDYPVSLTDNPKHDANLVFRAIGEVSIKFLNFMEDVGLIKNLGLKLEE